MTHDVINPATEKVVHTLELASVEDTDRAIARAAEAGNLSVNSHSSVRYSTPFGGYKQSGLGRELGPDALDAFSETKNIFISAM